MKKINIQGNLLFNMFQEHYKDGSFAGENTRKNRLIGVKVGIFLAICLCSLIAVGYMKWSERSLHSKLMQRHEQAVAVYDPTFYKNGDGASAVYSVGYTFTVNGTDYHNYAYLKTLPTSPEGIVYYDPDDPEENELQPF